MTRSKKAREMFMDTIIITCSFQMIFHFLGNKAYSLVREKIELPILHQIMKKLSLHSLDTVVYRNWKNYNRHIQSSRPVEISITLNR